MGGILEGLLGGGLLGGVASIFGKWFQERQRQQWEEKKFKHEIALLQFQSESRKEETEHELKVVQEAGRSAGLGASVQADRSLVESEKIYPVILNIRALWRPFLTLALLCLVGWIWYSLTSILADGSADGDMGVFSFLPVESVSNLLSYITYSAVFASSTAIMWWFGDRAITPPHLKHK